MEQLRITEIFPNPIGTDKHAEWIELCAGTRPTGLGDYALRIGIKQLTLSGSLEAHACSIARTGSASIRNREADISLLYKGALIQTVHTEGTGPEGFGFHVRATSSYWATSTPGVENSELSHIPSIPTLATPSFIPGLLGTAACTAGILTATALFALRYARNRYYAHQGGDPSTRR